MTPEQELAFQAHAAFMTRPSSEAETRSTLDEVMKRLFRVVPPVPGEGAKSPVEIADRVVNAFSDGMPKWIPVSESLPRDKEWGGIKNVLAVNESGVFVTSTHPSWWNLKDPRGPEFNGPIVTHWMPLPEAPK